MKVEEVSIVKGEVVKKIEDTEKKRRGRKRIKEKVTIKDQKKFFIDYSLETKKHELVVKLINEVNQKKIGREVVFKDLVDYALMKITSKDLERIQESTLGEMDKVLMLLEKHNEKSGENLNLGEFLVRQLKIS
ncbi:MAG: hypothetical protein COW00_00135 [Bdellovibrio sp. CG12_big_fil_rev_8_21_14_0_65_39_13]|nr:MAG: hypothetical protein COW78_19960 [Bdellovibrio sp. CG22_combo_CG10-13_8_21_14_all_39_27]PIQ62891.1 MAG: hypothetical protein COW00_00135 [Bdellovibrio sp. CG12_big_fil_rev_8_21_14_0_65_39_13]PIR33246.1 MAG: hypothetical protein COV37_16870 [Bdellovibrio sp. CG11_big_fil_rev_8_21_14_0_20_39_38]